MAFIRQKRTSAGHVYQVVRAVRVGGQPRQEVLCSLGRWATITGALSVERRQLADLERLDAMRQTTSNLPSDYLAAALPATRARVATLERVQAETGLG